MTQPTKPCAGGCPGFRWVLLGFVALMLLPTALNGMNRVGAWMWGGAAPCSAPESARALQGSGYGFDGEAIVVPWLAESLAFAGLSEARQAEAITRWRTAISAFDFGRYDVAAAGFAELAESLPPSAMRSGCYYNAACAHARLGETEPATLFLAKAMRDGFRDVSLITRDPDLDSIRDEPLYAYLIGLCEDQRFDALDALCLVEMQKRIKAERE